MICKPRHSAEGQLISLLVESTASVPLTAGSTCQSTAPSSASEAQQVYSARSLHINTAGTVASSYEWQTGGTSYPQSSSDTKNMDYTSITS